MPKFDASSISDVEYDFTGWTGARGTPYEGQIIDEKGIIPEPSPNVVSNVMARVSSAFKAMEMEVDETPSAIADAMQRINDEQTFVKLSDELIGAMDDVCDGTPSHDAMISLGWRRFMAFFGYVMGEVMSPEVGSAGTDSTQRRLKSV